MHSSSKLHAEFRDGGFMADEINSQTGDDDTNSGGEGAGTPGTPDAGTVANAAAKAHISRFSEKVLPGLIASAMQPLLAEIQALKAPKVDPDENKNKSKTSPEMAAVQAQLEDFKSKFAQAEAGRAAAEKKSRDDSARGALKDALSPHVRPELLGMLTDHLIVLKQVVEFDDDGTPLFKSKKPDIYGDLEDVRLPLKEGVTQFLKTEEAKAFLPSPGSSGAPPLKKTGSRANSAPVDLSTADESTKIRLALAAIDKAQGRT